MAVKLTDQDKVKIKLFAKKLVESRLLVETFASAKLADLHKKFLATDKRLQTGSYNDKEKQLKNAWAGISKLGYFASEIPDEQVIICNYKDAQSYMRENPDAIAFAVDKTSGLILRAQQGGKNLYISASKGHTGWSSDKDSANVKNQKTPKRGYAGQFGNAVDRSVGVKGDGSPVTIEILKQPNVEWYVILPTNMKQNQQTMKDRYQAFGETFATNDQFIRINNDRYKQLLKDRRAARFDVSSLSPLYAKILEIKPRIESFIASVLDKPLDYKYSSIDHSETYGTGRDRKTYTTSVLKLYSELHKSLQDAVESSSKGEKNPYGISSFNSGYKTIDALLKKNKF